MKIYRKIHKKHWDLVFFISILLLLISTVFYMKIIEIKGNYEADKEKLELLIETLDKDYQDLKDNNNKNIEKIKELEKNNEELKNYIQPIKDKVGNDVKSVIPIVFEVSYYSDLNCENGFGPITSTGEKLSNGMVANNILDIGTKIYIEGLGIKTINDRGSNKYFSKINQVDVFIPRLKNESDLDYYKRVNNLGRKELEGYILNY